MRVISSPPRTLRNDNFGLLIAYLLPGFVVLWAVSPWSPTIQSWLLSPIDGPSVGGFLYVTVGSTAAGLLVSVIRWALVDWALRATGIREPKWDFAKLFERLTVFDVLVEYHYRYYQAYANMLVALVLAYGARVLSRHGWLTYAGVKEVGLLLIATLLWLGARDTLRKYYSRVGDLLRAADRDGE